MRCCHNSGLNIRIFPLDSRGISRFITHDIGAQRQGTFKDLLRNDVVFVYGTTGDTEERAWAFNKSRFDAERFWYQGNGSIEVTSDTGLEWGVYRSEAAGFFGLDWSVKEGEFVFGAP